MEVSPARRKVGRRIQRTTGLSADFRAKESHGADNCLCHMWHVQDSQRIRPNKHEFMKGKSCLTDLISSFVKGVSLKSCGCWNAVYQDFSEAFDTVSHSILEKLVAYGLNRCTLP